MSGRPTTRNAGHNKSIRLSPLARRRQEAAAAIRGEPPARLSYVHAIFSYTYLPTTDPGDGIRDWQRQNGSASLLISAGNQYNPATRRFAPAGLPFGSRARLVLIHLSTEALRTQSPEIDVENSLSAFTRELGLHDNQAVAGVREQLCRLSAAIIRVAVPRDRYTADVTTGQFVEGVEMWRSGRRSVTWPKRVTLSEKFFRSIGRHAVPIDPRAVAAIQNSALALDLYSFLAQRMCRVPTGDPVFVPWTALYAQFGATGAPRKFRQTFLVVLSKVSEVYPGSLAIRETDGGLLVPHADPPARKLK